MFCGRIVTLAARKRGATSSRDRVHNERLQGAVGVRPRPRTPRCGHCSVHPIFASCKTAKNPYDQSSTNNHPHFWRNAHRSSWWHLCSKARPPDAPTLKFAGIW